jgi:hypothetical protein
MVCTERRERRREDTGEADFSPASNPGWANRGHTNWASPICHTGVFRVVPPVCPIANTSLAAMFQQSQPLPFVFSLVGPPTPTPPLRTPISSELGLNIWAIVFSVGGYCRVERSNRRVSLSCVLCTMGASSGEVVSYPCQARMTKLS